MTCFIFAFTVIRDLLKTDLGCSDKTYGEIFDIYWVLSSKSDICRCKETFILDKFIETELSAEKLDV